MFLIICFKAPLINTCSGSLVGNDTDFRLGVWGLESQPGIVYCERECPVSKEEEEGDEIIIIYCTQPLPPHDLCPPPPPSQSRRQAAMCIFS